MVVTEYPGWGPSRGRTMHYDPVLHVIVEGDLKLCTGAPGVVLFGPSNRVPGHACRRCVNIWKKQTDDS